MRKGLLQLAIVATIAYLSITTASADTTVLSMALSDSQEQKFVQQFNLKPIGKSLFTEGSVYKEAYKISERDDLNAIGAVFDRNKNLQALKLTVPQSLFDQYISVLQKKYNMVSRQNPLVGDRSATYKNGNGTIFVHAPSASFNLTISYIHKDLMQKLSQRYTSPFESDFLLIQQP